MIENTAYDEDIALKRFTRTPKEDKPRFDWRGVVDDDTKFPADMIPSSVKVKAGNGVSNFDLAEVAETVGNALTNLILSRDAEETDIYNDKNCQFVAAVSSTVATRLGELAKEGKPLTLSESEIYLLIEKTLIENNAPDVAKSLLLLRKSTRTPGRPVSLNVAVIRRNNKIVPWDTTKVEIAVRKAMLTLGMDSEPAVMVADAVAENLLNQRVSRVHIEEVQDIVQEELMRLGHYKVAEAYILYRAHRRHLRDSEIFEPKDDERQESMIMITLPNGANVFWDGVDLKKRIEFGMIGLDLCLNKEEIEAELRRSLYSEMKQEDLQKTIILNAKSLIERDADFSKFAGRILLSYIYEEVLDWEIGRDGIGKLKEAHQKAFRRYLNRGVEIGRINPQIVHKYDLGKLALSLDPGADMDFDYLGIQTLFDRYLIVDKVAEPSRRLEVPQFFWMRVSMGLFIKEEEQPEEWVIKLYSMYKSRRFCSSTPTLFNSGTLHSQLSSCYLYQVGDSIESIMQRGISENAYLSKWAGGLGGSWTSVRGTGSYIQGTNGESQGVIPFLKLHNDQLVAVNQGGKRRGSGCAYLETWHNDILDFLELRKNTGDDRRRTHDMNTANWIPDLFMRRMESRQEWTLFRSNQVKDLHDLYGKAFEEKYEYYEQLAEEGKIWGQKMPAIDLWKQMLKMLFETGHPWITFKDACNVRSPQDHCGVIHSSNLCTEITLNTGADETAVCNLGSVVLENHLAEDGSIDHKKLRETVQVAIRALDNVIDINFYPTEAARNANQRHRPIGMGIMGLQNALFARGHSFASEEAVEFNDTFMEAIAYYAYEASSDLAGERGTYSSYKGSKWDRGLLPQDTLDLLEKERGVELDMSRGGAMDWQPVRDKIARQGMRNSNVLAIAPTATISNIMGSSPCIEPTYKNIFVKSNLSGEFIVLNAHLVRELKSRNLWDDDVRDQLKYFDGDLSKIERIPEDIRIKYLTAFDIDHTWIVKAGSRRQKWIDQSQSVNLWLAHPDLKTLSHMYRSAWRMGLKTTYYLRTLGASNIEKATVSIKQETQNKKVFTEAEKTACSIEAMMNGEECEACQ
ncbi:ribonucleoside-diphosphate reductase subunit alpha [Puniceicoccales bacterium CK1056]|uniref:Ribonucleoside-diphosphate reductase n=1 Tax=Oceanipulchritudo coccoides TaxID=2706888 RepID=A0A6B2M273_9BACT|nr:ribonucleoside-diphosphate reductase subunit alpha [Oceanipulchritudo coccoides]NDV62432.1 ribonucleoside-diphosphate reductase subunit alpha [Oceanipulchritudo coccoides]